MRGTVRDPTNEAKLAPLKKAFGDKYSKLEIVKADLLDAESIDKAVEGCDYVIHVASPFPLTNPTDENELIKPAVDGTLNVMRAAHKHKVKRVVVTSSQVSVIMRKPENRKPVYNENDWSEMEYLEGYDKSKYLAEKAAWDFLKALPENERFELSVTLPGLIVGPSIVNDDFTSGQYIGAFMGGVFPQFPKCAFPVVDIRDISMAHLKCIKVPKAAGQRYPLSDQVLSFKGMSDVLKAHFGDKYPFATEEMAECPPDNKRYASLWDFSYKVDNSKTKKELGIAHKDIKKSLVEMAQSMIEHGLIPKKE